MARTKAGTRLIIASSGLVLVLLIAGGIALARRTNTADVPTTNTPPSMTVEADTQHTTKTAESSDNSNVASADPETLGSVDVQPLGVTVFYTKDAVEGFGFEVKQTSSTQYAEFSAASLTGTKCTNDTGLFATIIKDPSSTDQSSLAQTIKVGDILYGLSLAGKGCTVDDDLLDTYQAAFAAGFPSLKAL